MCEPTLPKNSEGEMEPQPQRLLEVTTQQTFSTEKHLVSTTSLLNQSEICTSRMSCNSIKASNKDVTIAP